MSYHQTWCEGGREWMTIPGPTLRDPVLIMDITVKYKSLPSAPIDWDDVLRVVKMIGDEPNGAEQ